MQRRARSDLPSLSYGKAGAPYLRLGLL